MLASSDVRQTLKQHTDPCHRRVDSAFSRFDLTSEAGLEAFLAAQAAALWPLENALESAPDGVAAALLPDWAERRRTHLLDGLGLRVPVLHAPVIEGRAQSLGVFYVLEGSKLGAKLLLSRVRGDGPFGRAAMAFLSAGRGSARWISFLQTLDRHAAHLDIDACLDGAIAAFALFERAATGSERHPGSPGASLLSQGVIRSGEAPESQRRLPIAEAQPQP